MSIRHHLWLTIINYLDDGQQSMHCGSDPCVIPAGVPQGWPSSHLPCVMCFNTCLPLSYQFRMLTSLSQRVGSLSGLTQKALDSMAQWGQESSQGLNGAKAIDMVNQCQETGQHSCSTISPTMSGQQIGVHILSDSSWYAHIRYMVRYVNPLSHCC